MTASPDASPIGTFNFAHSYLGAARALDRLDWRDLETHPDSPVAFLYWHAIELFLKAFLLADGMKIAELRQKKFGHNLIALRGEAIRRGLPLTDQINELLDFMPSTEAMIDLRYLRLGWHTRPAFHEIEDASMNIYRLVGAELKKRGINIGPHDTEI